MNLEIHKAIEFATLAHINQKRKTTDVPYIVHPFEVALILSENNCKESVVIAGILHDTVEDTTTTLDDIENIFGKRIASFVAGCSEDKSKSWEERKNHSIKYLESKAPIEVMQVYCADKLSNLRSLINETQEQGDSVWDKFNRGKAKQKWYYSQMIKALSSLEKYLMYIELTEIYEEIFVK